MRAACCSWARVFRAAAPLMPSIDPITPFKSSSEILIYARLACSALSPPPPSALASSSSRARHYWPEEQRRWYAPQARPSGVPSGAYTAPLASAQASQVRVTLISSNLVAEPYRGEPPKLPLLKSWLTPTGWKARWKRWMSSIKSIYTLAKVRRHVPDWTLFGFKKEAFDLYTRVCAALASGDRTELRHLVTPNVFSDMKRQLKVRSEGGWTRIEWRMEESGEDGGLPRIEVVQGRLIAIDPKNDSTGFVQLTVRFNSKQRFAAYNASNALVAGSLDEIISVEDYWVFERSLVNQASSKWRVAARLNASDLRRTEEGGKDRLGDEAS